MVARKRRTRVVIDTNVLVRNFKSRKPASGNRRIYRLWWVQRQLQLVVSPETIAEYVETFGDVLGAEPGVLVEWRARFETDPRCTCVNLAKRFTESRDPDDNVFLATALAGQAEYLITNDRDLLDLPADFRRLLPFEIVTPAEFLNAFKRE